MKISYLQEGYFNNPEQARKNIEKKQQISKTSSLASLSSNTILKSLEDDIYFIIAQDLMDPSHSYCMDEGMNIELSYLRIGDLLRMRIHDNNGLIDDDKMIQDARAAKISLNLTGDVLTVEIPIYPIICRPFQPGYLEKFSYNPYDQVSLEVYNTKILDLIEHLKKDIKSFILQETGIEINPVIQFRFDSSFDTRPYCVGDHVNPQVNNSRLKIEYIEISLDTDIDSFCKFLRENVVKESLSCFSKHLTLILTDRTLDKDMRMIAQLGEFFKFECIDFRGGKDFWRFHAGKKSSLVSWDGIENLLSTDIAYPTIKIRNGIDKDIKGEARDILDNPIASRKRKIYIEIY